MKSVQTLAAWLGVTLIAAALAALTPAAHVGATGELAAAHLTGAH